ncbi:YjdF family protein [Clostridium sp. AN503]|uniref:YjdF family protein n=1 Tax=Clostridium sp. AN503 TaxID=3160598 RepID=UPI00345801DF
MDKVSETLNVVFEDPFWIGVFERVADGKLTACKVTFGAEPKDYEVYDFIRKHYVHLRFSPAVEAAVKAAGRSPKRMQREVHRQVQDTGIGTRSQQALKLMQEQAKTERRTLSRERREEEKQRRFELKQQKKKEKHRGR